jgi:glycosyltransferase involved in cell wall biosynthesis
MTFEQGPRVFISLPVLNKAANIGPLLDDIDAALEGVCHVVCVVADSSRDGTREILEGRARSTWSTCT